MKQSEFHEHVMNDVLQDLPEATSKRMFGGYGLYLDGVIFGMIADDVLLFKVDDSNREQYEEAGSEPFVYTGHKSKGPVEMPYWTVPDDVQGDPAKAAEWAKQSAAVSKKSKR